MIAAAAISLACAGAIATPARSAAGVARPAVTSFTIYGGLYGVAATSAGNAWAVGAGPGGKTLILHWNGTTWSQVTNPKPVPGALDAVAAVSADDVWAVGFYIPPLGQGPHRTLVMHWNGKAWSRPASAPVLSGELVDVAVSGSSVWAVGGADNLSNPPTIMHWTDGRWYVVPSDAPVQSELYGVAATGASTAWAVGQLYNVGGSFLLRWNGTVWRRVSSPLQGATSYLSDLAAGPAGDVWAVGSRSNSTAASMQWNGKTWRTAPFGLAGSSLSGVTFVPGGTAWAVGDDNVTENSYVSLILRWTGRAWTQVAIPENAKDRNSFLDAVAATSPNSAWAVGGVAPAGGTVPDRTLILHWNGKTWS